LIFHSADKPAATIQARKIKDLTGPSETGRFAAPWTDLGIPALCPDGSMLFLFGDTFDGSGVNGTDWRAPVALRSSNPALDALTIDGAVGGAHAVGLVPEDHHPGPHGGNTTAIPSDLFTIGGTMYMHLMRGVIYQSDHTELWSSTDNGNTWTNLCQWPANLYGNQFQQKTYAVADDGFCYVLSSVFNRQVLSGLLLHRVPQNQVGVPNAYQPWGYANGAWQWGNPPTTITEPKNWGEICFRGVDGRYALTFLDNSKPAIMAQVFALPTSDLFATPEQTLIVNGPPQNQTGNVVTAPYGGFIIPGSTLENFHITVSQWYSPQDYRVMHYAVSALAQ
jgi:hypothetical protein